MNVMNNASTYFQMISFQTEKKDARFGLTRPTACPTRRKARNLKHVQTRIAGMTKIVPWICFTSLCFRFQGVYGWTTSSSTLLSASRQSVLENQKFYHGNRKSQSHSFTTSSTSMMMLSTTLVSVEETSQRDIGTFEEWAQSYGVQRAEGFKLADASIHNVHGQQTGIEPPPLEIGIMTDQDLPVNSPVLFVPKELIWSAQQSRQELGYMTERAEQLFDRLNVVEKDRLRFYLVLKLLTEYEQGIDSPWFPWLNALPRYFASGASMTHFCCTNCLPPLVGNLALEERTRFRQFFKALDLIDDLQQETRVHKQLAKWAYNIVYTRSFHDGKGDIKMAPMADMFNHDTQWEIQGRYDDEGNFVAHTTYDIPAGSPLRISYTAGDFTNPSFLLARYGFLDTSSPATFCKWIIDNPSTELVQMGYDTTKMLFYKDTGDVSAEVWDVILYQLLGEDGLNQIEDQRRLYQAHMQGDDGTKSQLQQQYFPYIVQALQQHVHSFLQQLDELSIRAEGRDLSVHPRLPLILEHNAFVKETFLKVQAKLEQYAANAGAVS